MKDSEQAKELEAINSLLEDNIGRSTGFLRKYDERAATSRVVGGGVTSAWSASAGRAFVRLLRSKVTGRACDSGRAAYDDVVRTSAGPADRTGNGTVPRTDDVPTDRTYGRTDRRTDVTYRTVTVPYRFRAPGSRGPGYRGYPEPGTRTRVNPG